MLVSIYKKAAQAYAARDRAGSELPELRDHLGRNPFFVEDSDRRYPYYILHCKFDLPVEVCKTIREATGGLKPPAGSTPIELSKRF